MQPTLAIVAPAPGMIALNGRFAGEVSPGEALLAAVPLCGAVYLEYRPLTSGWLPMARRLVLSGGAPMAESLPDGVFAVFWPGNITEIELSPDEAHAEIAGTLPPEGTSCLLVRGSQRRLEIGGLSCELPRGAQLPSLNRLDGCIALTGEARDGQYLLLLAPDFSRQTGALQADEIGFESAQVVRALTSAGDPSRPVRAGALAGRCRRASPAVVRGDLARRRAARPGHRGRGRSVRGRRRIGRRHRGQRALVRAVGARPAVARGHRQRLRPLPADEIRLSRRRAVRRTDANGHGAVRPCAPALLPRRIRGRELADHSAGTAGAGRFRRPLTGPSAKKWRCIE